MDRRIKSLVAAILLSGIGVLTLAAEGSAGSGAAPGQVGQISTNGMGALPGDGIALSIRFYDKRVYYPENEIPLKITIADTTASTYRFKLAEDRVYSLSFDVRSPTNRALEVADDYKRALATTKPVFFREIAVEPGEEYAFVEDLSRYIHVAEAGSYNIRAYFYPELVQAVPGVSASPLPPIASNVLILAVRPSSVFPPLAIS